MIEEWIRNRVGMSEELKALIEKARHYKITPEERREQLISMAYGNGHFDNPNITMEDIRAAADRLDKEKGWTYDG